MSRKPRCSHLTTDDRPPTTDGRPPTTAPPTTDPPTTDPLTTDPPTTDPLNTDPLTTDPLNTDPLPPLSPTPHLYFPRPTAAEQRVLAATAEEPDLQPEVELVRLVLQRLLAHLDESAGALPPEETRRVAALLFTGARTVALLMGKRPPARPEMEEWMAQALREMKDNYELRITNYEL